MFGGFETTTFTNDCGYRNILKVTTPKGVYSEEETRKIYKIIKEQVGDEYLTVVVPEGVTLEIIV